MDENFIEEDSGQTQLLQDLPSRDLSSQDPSETQHHKMAAMDDTIGLTISPWSLIGITTAIPARLALPAELRHKASAVKPRTNTIRPPVAYTKKNVNDVPATCEGMPRVDLGGAYRGCVSRFCQPEARPSLQILSIPSPTDHNEPYAPISYCPSQRD